MLPGFRSHCLTGPFETCEISVYNLFFFCLCLAEAAGTGRACGAAEGPPALGAERAAGSAGAAAERLGEDEERQPGLHHVVREVRLWQRYLDADTLKIWDQSVEMKVEKAHISLSLIITEDVEVDVESIVFDCLDSDGLSITHTDADHCYSSMDKAWLWLLQSYPR